MSATAETLPRWDVSTIFPGLESPDLAAAIVTALSQAERLSVLFDEFDIGGPTAPGDAVTFETIAHEFNSVLEQIETLDAYLTTFISTDTRNNLAQSKRSIFERETLIVSQLWPRLVAWFGSLDVEQLMEVSETARSHEYLLKRCRIERVHLMSHDEEALAAELTLTGGGAWERLHGNVTAQIMVDIELPSGRRQLPMSDIRNLAFDPDRETRRLAYEAELVAWGGTAIPLAAAINSIKGEAIALLDRRRWSSPIECALFQNHIDEETIHTLLGASRDAFPVFRRYLRAKASLFGEDRLAWFDLFAPVGAEGRPWSYSGSREFIVEHFSDFSPRIGELAARAFQQAWIDAEPRSGKVDGAFCMPIRRDESRVLANFSPSYSGMSTLAHELGHAYHNVCLSRRTPLQRGTPMTLAETASTFSQTIIRHAALAQASAGEELAILDGALQDATQVVVDISSRFAFESALFDRRREHEVSVESLNELMLETQRDTYGDGLSADHLHPYMWAVKGHYYSSSDSFYNYPYMFGHLFGLGLYAVYLQDPATFLTEYDDLLSRTGMEDAASLAERFGIDIRDAAFWKSGLEQIARDVDRFEQLIAR